MSAFLVKCFLWFVILQVHFVGAPPTVKCLVQQTQFYKLGDATDCDQEERRKLSDLVVEPVPAGEGYGAQNLADLILTRSFGIFDHERHNLERLYICSKHLNDLGNKWKQHEKRDRGMATRSGRVSKCNVPNWRDFKAITGMEKLWRVRRP